jgi:predicted O-methyltransferase YrrM
MTNTKIIDERISLTQYEPEFEILLEEYIKLQAKNVLEIGSYFGYSLHHWLYYSALNAKVISIDLPISDFCGVNDDRVPVQEYVIKNEWKTWTRRNKNKLQLIRDSSLKQGTIFQVDNLLENQPIDFLFIDGDHRYDAVKTDFINYGQKVRSGGLIALHDIGYAEEGGVHKLWDELIKESDFEIHKTLRLHPSNEKGIGLIYIK